MAKAYQFRLNARLSSEVQRIFELFHSTFPHRIFLEFSSVAGRDICPLLQSLDPPQQSDGGAAAAHWASDGKGYFVDVHTGNTGLE